MKRPPAAVVCVGDALIDEVRLDGRVQSFAGGGALNVAVALSRLGVSTALLADLGWDRPGQWLRSYLRWENVGLVPQSTVSITGLAISDRTNAEPSYSFGRFTGRRAIRIGPAAEACLADAKAVVVSSFAFGDGEQTGAIIEALSRASGLRVLDPNPRPALVADVAGYARGLEQAARYADLVKLSTEDVALLYGRSAEEVAHRYFALGVPSVVVTLGADGAAAYSARGASATVAAARIDGEVLDTMGAGDAAIAAIVARIVATGVPTTDTGWSDVLGFAMIAAAITCRRVGAASAVPTLTDVMGTTSVTGAPPTSPDVVTFPGDTARPGHRVT